jgi:hypothetical protein
LFCGDASEWGRILKGQHEARGEYLAVCSDINTMGYKSIAMWKFVKKKYGKLARKGKLVPRTKQAVYAFDSFRRAEIIHKILNMHFYDIDDEYKYYCDYCDREREMIEMEMPLFESYEEEKNAEQEFLDSLTIVI